MKSSENIMAEEIMDKNPVKAQNDQSVSQIKNKMEENGLRAIPVVDSENQLEGVIGYRDLIRYIQFNPKSTKLSKVMHQPPKFAQDDSLIELSELRINSGKKMLVNLKNKKLVGVISDKEFLEGLKNAEELEDISTKQIETSKLENVFEEDAVEKARHAMLDENISRLPVLDKDGKLTGIVRSTDILKMLVPRESQNTGGTSGSRTGKEINMSGGTEKEHISNIPVKEIMSQDVNSLEDHCSAAEAVEQMRSENHEEIIFVSNGYPESILTLKDLVDVLEQFAPGNTVLVNLIGLEVPEEKSAVHKKVRKQIQGSLGRKLKNPKEISLYIKKAEKDGNRHRYELDLKLYSEYGEQIINEEGWDLLDVVDEALNELNSVVRREKEKRTDYSN